MDVKRFWLSLLIIAAIFGSFTAPYAFKPPYGGERVGFTAGIIRIYCQEPGRSILKSPQVMLGHNPFNLEIPVFEWAQGQIARSLSDGDPECLAVEPVAKFFSIFWAAIGVIAVGWAASLLYKSFAAGIIAALLLACNHMWLEYSTLTMIETRTLALGLLGLGFSLKRRALLAALFWGLTFTHKPQFWLFLMILWLTAEFIAWKQSKETAAEYWRKKANWMLALTISISVALGLWYYAWISDMNTQSDLPWVQWMGPRTHKWYFGNFSDRVAWPFWKHLALDWPKRSGLIIALPILLLLRADIKNVVLRALPLLPALFIYPFIFYNVFVVHEYYAHPNNVGGALVCGGVLALALERARKHRALFALALLLVVAKVGTTANQGFRRLGSLDERIAETSSNWNKQVFPEKASFVVMAGPASGRDLLFLYLTRQRGYMWCNRNVEFAPRKFWKEQGVKYVAWAKQADAKTGEITWDVFTIEEELMRAREKGWSSDINDVWAGRTMTEWAAFGSRTGHDPCGNEPADFDPRTWK